jgi:hypothetical protein
MQINGSTSLVPEVLCTLRLQMYGERDVTAAFLPHQGQPLARGLIVVMILVPNVAFIMWCFRLSRLVAIYVDTICHLAGEYHCFFLIGSMNNLLIR